jgi:BMFP domain-containing protein YqiC
MDTSEIEALKARIEQLEAQLADDEDEDEDEDEDDGGDDGEGVEKAFVEAVVDGDEFMGLVARSVHDAIAATSAEISRLEAKLDSLQKAITDMVDGQEALTKALGGLPDTVEMVKTLQSQADTQAKTTPAPHVPAPGTPEGIVEKPGGNGSTKTDPGLLMKATQLFARGLELRTAGKDIPELNGSDLDHGRVTDEQLRAFVNAVETAA